MLALTLFCFLDMRTMEHDVEPILGARTLSLLAVVFCLGACAKFYFLPAYRCYRPPRTLALYLLYMLWVCVPTMLNPNDSDSLADSVFILLNRAMPMLSAVLTYNYILNHGDKSWFKWLFAFMSLAFMVGYADIFWELLSSGAVIQLVVSYYTIYILPLILLTAGKKTKILFIFLTLLILTTSMKRGGLVALGGGLMVYGLVYLITAQRVRTSTIVLSLLFAVALAGVFVYIGTSDEANVVERFENTENDEGSGRTVVWEASWQLIESSDFFPLIIGHGHCRVEQDSVLGISAHNDLLEIFYDYGLIGLLLYLAACISLMLKVWQLIRRKSPLAPVAALFFAVYFALSMISHIAIYAWFNIILLTISYLSARDLLEHEQNSI